MANLLYYYDKRIVQINLSKNIHIKKMFGNKFSR